MLCKVERTQFSFMGYSARTPDWRYANAQAPSTHLLYTPFRSHLSAHTRYTEWRSWDGGALAADWTAAGLVASELYNHSGHFADSPLAFDRAPPNVAADAPFAPVVARLAALLRAQFGPHM